MKVALFPKRRPIVAQMHKARAGFSAALRRLEHWLHTGRGIGFVRAFMVAATVFTAVMSARWLEVAFKPLPLTDVPFRFNLFASEFFLDVAPWCFVLSVALMASVAATYMASSLKGSVLMRNYLRVALGFALAGTLFISIAGVFDGRFNAVDLPSMEAEGKAARALHSLTPFEHALLLAAINNDVFARQQLSPRAAELVAVYGGLQACDQQMFQQLIRSSLIGDARGRALPHSTSPALLAIRIINTRPSPQ